MISLLKHHMGGASRKTVWLIFQSICFIVYLLWLVWKIMEKKRHNFFPAVPSASAYDDGRPFKSSDAFLGGNLQPFQFILKTFGFFRTLLVITEYLVGKMYKLKIVVWNDVTLLSVYFKVACQNNAFVVIPITLTCQGSTCGLANNE